MRPLFLVDYTELSTCNTIANTYNCKTMYTFAGSMRCRSIGTILGGTGTILDFWYTYGMKSFQEKVLEVVKGIKEGKVMTYGEVALRAGNAKALRAVGSIMAKNTDMNVPCHRVVKSDGSIGMYNGLRGKSKHEILKNEGMEFTNNGKIAFK